MEWADGSKFTGYWHNDKRVEGTLTFADKKTVYIGPFKNDKMQGIGKLLMANGIIY